MVRAERRKDKSGRTEGNNMRIAMICALGAWLALVVLQEALAARERSRLQRQAEAQERMWRSARDMQMRHWEEIGRKHDELDQQAGVLRGWEAELAQKEEQLRAQQQMLEELAKQIVTGQDAGTTNEAGTV
ncbi:MAG: hypothetical protein ACLUVB_00400 [Acutalibacteraceae bacterium]